MPSTVRCSYWRLTNWFAVACRIARRAASFRGAPRRPFAMLTSYAQFTIRCVAYYKSTGNLKEDEMAELLYRLGKMAARRSWTVVGAWIVVAAIAAGGLAIGFKDLTTSFDIPGT